MLLAIAPVALLALLAVGALLFAGGAAASASEDCGRVQLSPALVVANMDKLQGLIMGADPNGSAFELVSKVMQLMFPGCSFSRTATATIVAVDGATYEWQALVAIMGSKTVAQISEDPEFAGFMTPEGKDSSIEPGGPPSTLVAARHLVGMA